MTQPTIANRLRKRILLMTADQAYAGEIRPLIPDDWELQLITDLEEVGEWHEILLYKFLLLDLDEVEAFDPIDVIRILRMQYQINLPVFCFGGDQAVQEEMRMARADRFLSREEMLALLPQFIDQYR